MSGNHWTPKDDGTWRRGQDVETPHLAWYLTYHDLAGWQGGQETMFLATLVGLAFALIVAAHQLPVASVWPRLNSVCCGEATPFQLGRTPFWDLVDLRAKGPREMTTTQPGEFGLMSIRPNRTTPHS
jgi:hypothetical protein